MLDRVWLGALVVLDLWALWASHELLALCATLGLLVALSIVIWRRFSLSGVGYERHLAGTRARFGDVIELTVEITNGKILPLPLLQIRDDLPRNLPIDGGTVRLREADQRPYLQIIRSMLPYERVIRHLHVRCTRRGDHHFGPARWESGDYLGAATQYRTAEKTQRLLVLPKLFPLVMRDPGSNQILGRDAARRWLFSDPLRAVGARDYAPGDPMRFVDWRATARRGSLMVRELEPSTTPTVQIVLNFRASASRALRYEPDEIEMAISVAASIAAYGAARKWRLGLSANGGAKGAPIAVAPSSAPEQLGVIVETLAHAANVPTRSFVDLLLSQRSQRYERASLIVVTTHIDKRMARVLADMHRRGESVLVVLIATADEPVSLGGLPVLHVDYDERWTERDALVLAA